MTFRYGRCAVWGAFLLSANAGAQVTRSTEPWAEGWFANGSLAGRRTGLDTTRARTGISSGHLTLVDSGTALFSVFLNPTEYIGKRVRFSAYVKTAGRAGDTVGSAGLWMRVDGSTRTHGFDNMSDRPIRASSDWVRHEIVLDVPEGSIGIALGFLIWQPGEAWIDDCEFEVVPATVPTTGPPVRQTPIDPGILARMIQNYQASPSRPTNLGFEVRR